MVTALAAAAAAAGLVVAWAVWWSPAGPAGEMANRSWPELVGAIAAGEPGAVAAARQRIERDWPGSRDVAVTLLNERHWRVRKVGVDVVAGRGDPRWVPVLLPRATDVDWRVRASAFGALGRFAPLDDGVPHRDTTPAERDRRVLAWLDAYDAGADRPLAPELCELYAGVGHVEFGPPLAERCLRCHVGSSRRAHASARTCAACHPDIHRQWAGSAHAQSLSHLFLVTVDPATRRPQRMDFSPLRGVHCHECHPPRGGAPASAATAPSTRPAECPLATRRSEPAAALCGRCHHATGVQWRAWLGGRQPRRAVWPPGQVELEVRGDRRGCVACHMARARSRPGATARQDHAWSARRSARLLTSGIDLRAEWVRGADGADKVRLHLVNLAGHACPTGTRRRALELRVGRAGDASLERLTTLSPVRPGRPRGGVDPALAPGEERTWTIDAPADGGPAAYRLIYHRNLGAAGAYEVEVASGSVAPLPRAP